MVSSSLLTGVFVGGTSGIGQGLAEAFARQTQGNANIIIVGRNKAAAEAVIAKFPKPSDPSARHEFVSCDASLMKNIRATSKELLTKNPTINYLVMSPGILSTAGRTETEEGIDKKLAVHYYARFVFTNELLCGLKEAKEKNEEAKVLSVLAAGRGGKLDLEDLGLKRTFSIPKAASQAPTYNDVIFDVGCRSLLCTDEVAHGTHLTGIRFAQPRAHLRSRLPRDRQHESFQRL
jgi:NAD(P)-dependent dehydrogenase (short-subunit alcohol dehydrogenase family)